MQTKTANRTKRLTESALMLAIGTVLSILPLAQLPYGGSVTVASMLPVIIISYRNGLRWGLGTGLAFGVLQQLLGLSNLSYFTTWQSILAIILLDYLVAFAVVGLGGAFRGTGLSQSTALMLGALGASTLRYLCHVISGATVWAGLSIPTEAALGYSFIYNATYMLPEAIITVLVAGYLGALLDFRRERLSRLPRAKSGSVAADVLGIGAGAITLAALVFDTVMVFPRMQNAETGEFDLTALAVPQLAGSFWLAVIIVSAVAGVLAATAMLLRRHLLRSMHPAA